MERTNAYLRHSEMERIQVQPQGHTASDLVELYEQREQMKENKPMCLAGKKKLNYYNQHLAAWKL